MMIMHPNRFDLTLTQEPARILSYLYAVVERKRALLIVRHKSSSKGTQFFPEFSSVGVIDTVSRNELGRERKSLSNQGRQWVCVREREVISGFSFGGSYIYMCCSKRDCFVAKQSKAYIHLFSFGKFAIREANEIFANSIFLRRK